MTDLFSPEALATYLVTAIVTALSLLIIFIVVKKLLYKPLSKTVEQRKALIESQLNDAAAKSAEAQSKAKAAQAQLDAAHSEAAKIVASANSRALLESDSIVTSAQHEAAEIAKRAEAELKQERNAMIQDLRTEVTSLSMAIATKLVGEAVYNEASRSKVESWIDEQLQTDAVNEKSSEAETNADHQTAATTSATQTGVDNG